MAEDMKRRVVIAGVQDHDHRRQATKNTGAGKKVIVIEKDHETKAVMPVTKSKGMRRTSFTKRRSERSSWKLKR